MIDKDRLRNLFLELLAINSPSKKERRMADFVFGQLSSLGFEVFEDDAAARLGGEAGNIIGFKKGTVAGSPCILLSGHIDTVESTDNLNVVIDGDEVRSDGSTILGADDKAGVASILEGLRSVVESGAPHGNIEIVFDVAEEIGLLGARVLDMSKIKARMAYIFDTEKPVAGITLSAPTQANIDVVIQGRSAHAGLAPEKGVNAIVAASRAISGMKLGRLDDETTANVGVIDGGKAGNIVPDLVHIRAEARSRDEGKLDAQISHMKKAFEAEVATMGVKVEFEAKKEFMSFRWAADDEIVKLASAASTKLGIEPVLLDGGGGSDANVFSANGLPAVVIGVGYEGAHSLSECVRFSDLVLAARYAESLILTAAEYEA